MLQSIRTLQSLASRQRGASAVEYGLVVGLIAVALILVLTALGGGLEGLFQEVVNEVTGEGGGGDAPADQ